MYTCGLRPFYLELEQFYTFSGLKINHDKCVVLKVGPHRHTEARYYTLKKLLWSTGPVRILGIDIFPDIEVIYEHNYYALLNKASKVLETWAHRRLTLIGKITIINTLVNTLFTHKFLSLPSPPEDFWVKYKRMISNFLWADKKARIAYNKLIQGHWKLGLKLIDLKTKDTALKAAWPIRWNDRDATEVQYILNTLPITDKTIWDCNISPQHVKEFFPGDTLSPIPHVWLAWAKLSFKPTLDGIDDILFQSLCGNSLIKRLGKPFLLNYWSPPYPSKIIDLVHPTELRFYQLHELQQIFSSVDILFLNYCAMLAAIPNVWKIEIRNTPIDHVIDPSNTLIFYENKEKPSRYMYWDLIEKFYPVSKILASIWERELNIQITHEELCSLYANLLTYTTPTKLREFQYRLYLRELTTNVKRHRWNTDVSPLCSFCNSSPETLHHLFWDCPKVQKIWECVKRILKHFLDIEVDMCESCVMLNNFTCLKKDTVNIIVLIVKQYIYASKCLQEDLNFNACMSKIVDYYNADKILAVQNGNLPTLYKKWGNMFS